MCRDLYASSEDLHPTLALREVLGVKLARLPSPSDPRWLDSVPGFIWALFSPEQILWTWTQVPPWVPVPKVDTAACYSRC